MGLCLIGMSVDWTLVLVICEVAIGLGMVIFVHELGHFVVAKLCGVKCEKFYLGFDIGGWKICRVRWGETEYGIGVLPLGGYVKMLGQEDNPARLRQEIERAKLKAEGEGGEGRLAAAIAPRGSANDEGRKANDGGRKADDRDAIDLAAAEQALYDPRSYLAKSVPKRMAIISAGVVMNVIFAFLMASCAYWLGVKQIRCGVGMVVSGEGGWKAGLRVGDQFEEIAGRKVARFDDLRNTIMVGDLSHGVPMVIHRPGLKEPLRLLVTPDRGGMVPRIGVGSPSTTALVKSDEVPPVIPGTPAAQAEPALIGGDKIVAIDGHPVDTYAQLEAYLIRDADRPLRVTVERPQPPKSAGRSADRAESAPQLTVPAERLTIDVAPRPMLWLGLTMEMGEIAAIQDGSPAAQAGVREGDRISAINGVDVGKLSDPLMLPDWLRKHAGQTITLTIERSGEKQPIELKIPLREADWPERPDYEKDDRPISSPNLGIAYYVLNRVANVAPGTPAEKAGIKPGDVVTEATLLPPEEPPAGSEKVEQRKAKIELGEKLNWPAMMYVLQSVLPGTTVELTFQSDRDVTLVPVDAPGWFNPDRGLNFEPDTFVQQAHSIGQSLVMGADETRDALLLVARFLQKLGTQISPRALGGPITIVRAAAHFASKGVPDYLVFLTMLSANLAVLNFLPIPLLDGGHMVFLAWEGIRRKPPNERVQTVLTILGLIFIAFVMLWAIGLDFERLFH